jgi:hypothetical protein
VAQTVKVVESLSRAKPAEQAAVFTCPLQEERVSLKFELELMLLN